MLFFGEFVDCLHNSRVMRTERFRPLSHSDHDLFQVYRDLFMEYFIFAALMAHNKLEGYASLSGLRRLFALYYAASWPDEFDFGPDARLPVFDEHINPERLKQLSRVECFARFGGNLGGKPPGFADWRLHMKSP